MKRIVFALSLAAATVLGCVNLSDSGQSVLVVAPVLDSVFAGDKLPARDVYVLDATGSRSSPGPVTWAISPESVATINAATGEITGVSKGLAVVLATASGVTTPAVVAVSRPLEMTLQLDTIYLMAGNPGDTITVPVAIKQKTPAATTLQFDASPTPSVYTIDVGTGLVTAHGEGAVVYRAHLTDGTNTVTDSGAIVVMGLTDTTGAGRFFMTAFGTATRHQSGGALALNYLQLNPSKQAFALVDSLTANAADEWVQITLPAPLQATGTFEIDSISPQEATARIGTVNAVCNPKRPWAFWSSTPSDPHIPRIIAYSHGTSTSAVAGQLIITQYLPAPVGGGTIISGRYAFRAQRFDLYGDPLGLETIRGTFVAPLRTRTDVCQG